MFPRLSKPRIFDLTGRTYGRLTVKGHMGSGAGGNSKWLCSCSCGKEVIVYGLNLKSGRTRACGCLKSEAVRASNRTRPKVIRPTNRVGDNPWRKLAIHVIAQAFRDLKQFRPDTPGWMDAKAFLSIRSDDLEWWCELAELPVDDVLAKGAIK